MWRCALADDAPDSPFVRTLNGHAGRQQWIFDEHAGSAKERAEIERLRQAFTDNRHSQKHSSDELYRRACAGRRKTRTLPRVPGGKLAASATVTEPDVTDALKAAAAYYATLQVVGALMSELMRGCLLDMPGKRQ